MQEGVHVPDYLNGSLKDRAGVEVGTVPTAKPLANGDRRWVKAAQATIALQKKIVQAATRTQPKRAKSHA